MQASLAGSPGIAIGNIVGSDIANIPLILGISALVALIVSPALRAHARHKVNLIRAQKPRSLGCIAML